METSNANRNCRKEIAAFCCLVSFFGVKVDTLFLITKTTMKQNGFLMTQSQINQYHYYYFNIHLKTALLCLLSSTCFESSQCIKSGKQNKRGRVVSYYLHSFFSRCTALQKLDIILSSSKANNSKNHITQRFSRNRKGYS